MHGSPLATTRSARTRCSASPRSGPRSPPRGAPAERLRVGGVVMVMERQLTPSSRVNRSISLTLPLAMLAAVRQPASDGSTSGTSTTKCEPS